MQITDQFIRRHLGVPGLLGLILAAMVVFSIMGHMQDHLWSSYVFIAAQAFALVLLALLIRQILRDEKKRQAAAEHLEASDEKYKSLLETSTDGTMIVMDGKIVFANFVSLAISGYTLKEMISLNFKDLFMRNGGDESIDPVILQQELGETGKTHNLEALVNCKRGERREVILGISKLQLLEKEGLLIIIKDMAGRERMEHESLQLQNELHSSLLMMNLPVSSFTRDYISCDMDTPVKEAALMMHRKQSDVLILTKSGDDPVGILTDSDLRNRVLARDLSTGSPVYEVMSSPLVRIPDESLLYEGILKFREHSISHLVVEDRNGRIKGVFSNQDMLEVQRNSISFLIREVNAANTVEALKKIHNRIPVLVRILMESGARINNVTYMISTITDAITQRVIDFALEESGRPPARFAFMALGSEGRREQTLVTDQDNAIIIEDVPNERLSEVTRYFLYLGKKINLWLDRIGYQYCKGEVMAGNPQWCQPLSRWKNYFNSWIKQKSPEGLLGMAVFFDFRIVYGEEQFLSELKQHIYKLLPGSESFFSHLAGEVAAVEIPVDIFRHNGPGAGSKTPESFNIKNALFPLTGFLRVYALHNRIGESNTLQRLEKLKRLNILPESDCQELEKMYFSLMEIRFRSQVHAVLSNRAPDNLVGEEELTAMEQTLVRKAFSEIKRFQERITLDFCP